MATTSRTGVPVTVTVPWSSRADGTVAAPAWPANAVIPPTAVAATATVRATCHTPVLPPASFVLVLVTEPSSRSRAVTRCVTAHLVLRAAAAVSSTGSNGKTHSALGEPGRRRARVLHPAWAPRPTPLGTD